MLDQVGFNCNNNHINNNDQCHFKGSLNIFSQFHRLCEKLNYCFQIVIITYKIQAQFVYLFPDFFFIYIMLYLINCNIFFIALP